ncbi:uncharacterized protein LOC143847890 [Tasmannia lanceolata]|uniref:uncharacterized protein LOC143847890 n=1 Tax=Tasmannia lanceolata TaxID=3420 RepID=UPI004062FD11
MALFLIQQAMDEPIFSRIMATTTSKEACDLLQEEYQGTTKLIYVKLQTLHRDFENLNMKNSESIQVFFSRVSSVVNQIRTYGEKLDDQKIVEKVLRSLFPKFDHVVAAIEESKDLSTYSMNELMGSLQAHEQRLNRTTEKPLEQAFQSKWIRRKDQMIQIKVSEEEEVVDVVDSAAEEEVEANSVVIRKMKGEVTMNLLLYFAQFAKDQIMLIRIVDSGCSNHMTGNKYYFLEIDETVKPRVRMSDNNHVNAHGIGPIVVSTLVGKNQIQDVMRYGHLNFGRLSLLQKLNMTVGIPSLNYDEKVCEACVLGKHHREQFPSGFIDDRKSYGTLKHRSRVYCCYNYSLSSNLATKDFA